jgi:hypothetical protein
MFYKGIFEIEVDGVKRGFKTGTLASAYFCAEEGVKLKSMTESLQDPSPMTVINMGYAAARAFNESKKLPVDFTKDDVSDWIDSYGLIEFLNKIFESMKAYEEKESPEKNQPAPNEGQTGK